VPLLRCSSLPVPHAQARSYRESSDKILNFSIASIVSYKIISYRFPERLKRLCTGARGLHAANRQSAINFARGCIRTVSPGRLTASVRRPGAAERSENEKECVPAQTPVLLMVDQGDVLLVISARSSAIIDRCHFIHTGVGK
jgi:hypothetical protein